MAIDTEERTKKSKNTNTDGKPGSSNKKAITIVLIIVGVLVLLGVVGTLATGFLVKKGTEGVISRVSGGKVDIDTSDDSANLAIKGEGGEELEMNTGKDVKLSENYPKSEVPIYKGAEVKSSSDMSGDSMNIHSVTLETDDKVRSVIKFYEESFSGTDWQQTYSANMDGASRLMYSNEEKGISATVSASSNDDTSRTSIVLSVTVNEA